MTEGREPARVLAVSDVHGYRDDLMAGLRRAGLVDESGHWTGGDARLWLLGDLLDRGPDGAGAVELAHRLDGEAPGQAQLLLGNHELLALGRRLCPDSDRFLEAWWRNGGQESDQERLTPELVDWLLTRAVLGREGGDLLMHSDTESYLDLGGSVDQVNATVAAELATGEESALWGVFALLTARYDFARAGGAQRADRMLGSLGGERLVHGHSIIGTLVDLPADQVHEPLSYCEGRALAIDGGRYDGGPLLVVQLG